MTTFAESLAFGKAGESRIAQWLLGKGWSILPIYEKILDEGKGPQLLTPAGSFIAPDLLVFHPFREHCLWIEAKHKSVFSWHRLTGHWCTGIDLHHYDDYQWVQEHSPWPVWILFLHTLDRLDSRVEPWPCPTGLFGQTLDRLQQTENHRHCNWGTSGMVYWAVESLVRIASLQDLGMNRQKQEAA